MNIVECFTNAVDLNKIRYMGIANDLYTSKNLW